MRNKKKSIENLKALLIKNNEFIERIIVSEGFMQEVIKYPNLISIDVYFDEDFGDIPLMEGIPITESETIQKNAVLELKNGEFIIITLEGDK
jgi:hypothetical protein